MRQMRALPGVEQVAYAIRSPLMPSEGGMAQKVLVPGHTDPKDAPELKYNAVSAAYLSVTGTSILNGRGFEPQDDISGPPVVVINRTMARRYWKSQDPVGQTIHLSSRARGCPHHRRCRRRSHQCHWRAPRAVFLFTLPLSELGRNHVPGALAAGCDDPGATRARHAGPHRSAVWTRSW